MPVWIWTEPLCLHKRVLRVYKKTGSTHPTKGTKGSLMKGRSLAKKTAWDEGWWYRINALEVLIRFIKKGRAIKV